MFCNQCNHQLDPNSNVCPNCKAVANSSEDFVKKERGKALAILIVIIGFMLVGGYFYYMNFAGPSQREKVPVAEPVSAPADGEQEKPEPVNAESGAVEDTIIVYDLVVPKGKPYYTAAGVGKDCPGNNFPYLKGPFKYEAVAGKQICIDVISEDVAFDAPAGKSQIPPTKVSLAWNQGIKGGAFTIVNPGENIQRGRFCWTPTEADISNTPYVFAVTATDNGCPQGTNQRSYRIHVKK